MPIVDPKVNEVVLKLNKLTQDGRLEWRKVDPVIGLGGEQERFETTYSEKSFQLTSGDPLAVMFTRQRGLGTARLEILDSDKKSLYTFPQMASIDDLLSVVKQRLEKRKVDLLLDEFLNNYE